jgi:hypothetical protein
MLYMCHHACIHNRSQAFCFGADGALETFEETRPARLYFHMRIAAKLSLQVGSMDGCRPRGINGLSEGQRQRYGSGSGKSMLQGTPPAAADAMKISPTSAERRDGDLTGVGA